MDENQGMLMLGELPKKKKKRKESCDLECSCIARVSVRKDSEDSSVRDFLRAKVQLK